jgi:hypothetical protein
MSCNGRKRIMVYRTFSLFLTALALVLVAGTSVPADETKKGDAGKTAERGHRHEGTVVSVTADKFVMKSKSRDGTEAVEHTHRLTVKAKVTCDGKACKLLDLKPGQKVRVTTLDADKTMATRVEALNLNERFEPLDRNEFEKKAGDKNPR